MKICQSLVTKQPVDAVVVTVLSMSVAAAMVLTGAKRRRVRRAGTTCAARTAGTAR